MLSKCAHMNACNSEVAFYATILDRLHTDVAELLGFHHNRTLKFEKRYMRQRIEVEGFAFLTQHLPALGKAVDTALARGTPLNVPPTFKRRRRSKLPRFLGNLLECIFDGETGLEICVAWELLGVPLTRFDMEAHAHIYRRSIQCLKHFRQLVFLFYKLELEYKPEQVQSVLDGFVTTDRELAEIDISWRDQSKALECARRIASDVFGRFDVLDISPQHGPGAVATGEKAAEKSKFTRIYSSIEKVYPFTEYFQFNLNHVVDAYPGYNALEYLEEPTAKVVLVPKDSRGPRLISCEPLESQWIQQGLGRKMASHLEVHRITRGQVNFTDQSVNRDLAMLGSLGAYQTQPYKLGRSNRRVKRADWVTLDLKDASDRVSLNLVKEVFAYAPRMLEALVAVRSTATVLPDGRVVKFNKYAPMGSALCFPVEAFVFYALAVSAIVEKGSHRRREAQKRVFVYGDDIICHKEDYLVITAFLEKFGLKLNEQKCCTEGFFRESCGCDAYRGVDVTPTRLRAVWSSRRSYNPDILCGYTAFSNAMFRKGYVGVVNYVRSHIVRVWGPIPYSTSYRPSSKAVFTETIDGTCTIREGATWTLNMVEIDDGDYDEASGVVFYTNDSATVTEVNKRIRHRFDYRYHVCQYQLWMAKPLYEVAIHEGYDELLRRHMGRLGALKGKYAVQHRSRLKRCWAYVYNAL
jgi:hypothetical protein